MITIDLGDNKTLQVSGVVEHFEAEKCKQLLSQYIAKTSEHSIQIDISKTTIDLSKIRLRTSKNVGR